MAQTSVQAREPREIAKRLLVAKKKKDIMNLVQELIDHHGASWRLLGDDESNWSTVGMASSPVASWTERLTNAIDAKLEDAVTQDGELIEGCYSPRTLVERAFGVKGGYLTNVAGRQRTQLLSKVGISTILSDGDSEDTPTIDICDEGIGLSRGEVPKTILSLHKGNKIKKWYLMGRYGQGGSTTFRFCELTTIFSRKRHHANDDEIVFTVVKYRPAEQGEKDGNYVYLVNSADQLPFALNSKAVPFKYGTLVRHVNYNIGRKYFLDVYGSLEARLFDPVLPFWLEERREWTPNLGDKRSILGSRDRLESSDMVEADGKGELSVPVGPNGEFGNLTVRYWVFKEGVETKTKITFININEPIVVTYLGQTHASLPRGVLNYDCKLPYLSKDLVVQVDCDGLTDAGRRAIFTTTREVITSDGYKLIRSALVKTLPEELGEFDEKRQLTFLSKGITKQQNEMRGKLAEMINRIKPGTFQIAVGAGQLGGTRRRRQGRRRGRPPLPTKEFPTFIRISNLESPIKFSALRNTWIGIESDAPDGFLANTGADLQLIDEGQKYAKIVARHTDFKGGRLYLSLGLVGVYPNGSTFKLSIRLTAGGTEAPRYFDDSRDAIVVEPKGGGTTKLALDAPNIITVSPESEDYRRLEWTVNDVAEVKEGDTVDIYVSLGNKWYFGTILNSNYTPGTKEVLKWKYALHIALYAYLQHKDWQEMTKNASVKQNEDSKSVPEETLDNIKHRSLDWAARTIATVLTSEKAFQAMDATSDDSNP